MKLRDYIVCDDIRFENGNKVSLMGIYDDGIRFQRAMPESAIWPKPLRLAFYVRFEHEPASKEPFPETFQVWQTTAKAKTLLFQGIINRPNIGNVFALAVVHPAVLLPEGKVEFGVSLMAPKDNFVFTVGRPIEVGLYDA